MKRGGATKADQISEAVLKYIPGEVITVYVAVAAGIAAASSPPSWLVWAAFLVPWIITPFYMYYTTRKPGEPTPTAQIVVATISFFVWVVTLGGPFATLPGYSSIYGAVILPVYTLIPPMILRGKP